MATMQKTDRRRDSALVYKPESELTARQQWGCLAETVDPLGLKLTPDGETSLECEVRLSDVQLLIRYLDDAPPLRGQLVEELHRVARFYDRLAERVRLAGLDEHGEERRWGYESPDGDE